MEAETLSISIPYKGCDKDCRYCISKMTGYTKTNREVMMKNYPKVVQMAKTARVNKVIITAKGEPTLNPAQIRIALKNFWNFPTELNTNGITLNKDERGRRMLEAFSGLGLNTLSLSIDQFLDILELADLIKFAKGIGLVVRVSILVTDHLGKARLDDFIDACEADQFTLARVTYPTYGLDDSDSSIKAVNWIMNNVRDVSDNFIRESIEQVKSEGRLLRGLSYGPSIYEYRGRSFSYFESCIQNSSLDESLRSLIFQEDGHLYYCWNSKASIIF